MRHKTSLPRRAAALGLALLLALPTAVRATAGERRLQTSTAVTDGLTYRNTVTVNNNSRVESYALELAPNSPVRPILLQGDTTIYGNGSISRAISNAQAQGWHVLGGINTDFFSLSNGIPIGMVIENGVYKSSNDGENAMAIVNNQVVIVDRPSVSMYLYNHNNGVTVLPDSFNKARHSIGGLYLLNEHFSTVSTRSDGAGWYVRMRAVPDPFSGQISPLTVNSALTLEVTELLQSDQSLVIGPNEYILTASDLSNRGDAFASFQMGDRITLTTTCADPALSAAQWAGGVGDIMVRNGVLTDSESWVYASDGRQPRSALGIKADGTLVLYAVDGRQSGYSVGLSQRDLANELLSQGCVTAVNLDGGGSTSLSVWVPGQNGPALQNKPSDGRARGCATYLLLVTDQLGNGIAQRLAPAETGQVVLTGSSLTLPQAAAIDAGLNLVSSSVAGLTYTSAGGLGTIQENTYLAGQVPGTDILRLTSGSLEGTAQVHVVNQLTEFKVSRAGSSEALTALTVKPGEQIQLAVSGSYWGRTALRDFAPVTVTVQGDVGAVDQTGLFTASPTLGSGSITFSAGGMSQTVSITPSYVHNDVTEEHWAYAAVEYCYAKGIVSGISPTEFGRDYPMIRGDFMLMLYNAVGRPAVTVPCTFTDVAPTDYYYSALAWAQNLGLASGVGDGKFAPRDPITREQAFSLFYRFLPISGKSCPDGSLSVLDQFKDCDKIADFAKTACATLVTQGLASGSDGSIDPKGTLTRAQMASLLYRVLEHTPVIPVDPVEPVDPVTPADPAVPTDPAVPADPVSPTDPVIPGNYLLALDQSQVTLASGGSVSLNAAILPAVEGAAITWSSGDSSAAVVTNGMVTNLHPGAQEKTVTITASWNGISAGCEVTCQPAQHAGTVTGADTGLNVRSGPGTTHPTVGGLRNGAQAVVLGYQDGWYQILFRNADNQAAIGYVTAEYFTLDR